MHRLVSTLLLAGSMAGLASMAQAVVINEPFTGSSTGPGWTLDGSATLTGTGAPDPVGSGWLRLTPASGGLGYAYHSQVLPITERITVTFEFADWGGTGADGLTFFLFNAGGPGAMAVSAQLQTGATVSNVLTNVVVSGLPANVRFGLSAATGGQTNNHEVRNFSLVSGTPTIPTLSEWSILILASTLLVGSLVVLSRRRREGSAR